MNNEADTRPRQVRWRDWLQNQLPSVESLSAFLSRWRWLRPYAHRLGDRRLWRARGEPLARGIAVGMFWAFVIPFAQVLFAAAHCVWWRASIPVAAAATFITNPITIGGWLVLAYHAGAPLVEPIVGHAAPPLELANGERLLAMLQSLGLATVVGMGLFAVGGAVGGYLLTRALAWAWLHLRRTHKVGRPARRAGRAA